MLLRLKDRALGSRLQGGANAREHLVERREVAHVFGADALGDLLNHTEHRTLAHRAVLALEHVVVGQTLDRGLEHWDLVGDERIRADEPSTVDVVAVGLRSVDAGEVDAGLEPGLDLGEIVALLPGAVTDDLIHVLLRGDEDPRLALAFRVEGLGNRLQVQHELDVVGDELADLVDKEVESKARFLLVDPRLDRCGEVLDRHGIGLLVLSDDPRVGLTVDLGERLVDVVTFQGGLLAPLRPVDAGVLREDRLERLVLASLVEILLEPGDGAIVSEVAAAFIENLDEYLEQRVSLVLGDQGRLLVNIEEQALRRDGCGFFQRGGEQRVVGLAEEALAYPLARERLTLHVAKKVREHLEQVGLTGAEEARDPHAVGICVVGVLLQQRCDALRGVVGEDILLDLGPEVVGVVGLDDALDRAGDVLEEDLVEFHRVMLPGRGCAWRGRRNRL